MISTENSGTNLFILIPILIYFSGLMYLGFLEFRKTKTFSDYVLGSRKLGAMIGTMNVGASDMSSWLLMGLPGVFYLYGMNQVWMVFGLIFGSYASWKIIAVRLRKFTELAVDSLTLSSFLENRFADKSGVLSVITSIVIIFFFTIYIASGFVGSTKLFAEVFSISYANSLIISAVLIISYAFIGLISGALGAIIFSKIPFFSYEILPAFLLSSLLIYAVSFFDRKNIPTIAKAHFIKLKRGLK